MHLPAGSVSDIISAWFPEKTLTFSAELLFTTLPLFGFWLLLDHRTISDERVALKPIRFVVSIGIYLFALSWIFNFVRIDRIHSLRPRSAVFIAVIGCAWELMCIVFQAARARRSHFNRSTLFDRLIFLSMGLMAVAFIGAGLPLVIEISLNPRKGSSTVMIAAIVFGYLTTLILGTLTGLWMSRISNHTVSQKAERFPVLGRNLSGGDLRISHFFSIHALEIFPLFAFGLSRLNAGYQMTLFALVASGYVAVTVLLFISSVRGKSALQVLNCTLLNLNNSKVGERWKKIKS